MTRAPVVQIEDLDVGFHQGGRVKYVYRGMDLTINKGDLVCLLGPSGAGKSVLLNLLIGVLKPGSPGVVIKGKRQVLGEDINKNYPPSLFKQLGVVFQESALFEDLTVRENAGFGLKRSKLSSKQVQDRVDLLLESVGLDDPPKKVNELSGGQKKRLALARTLAAEPDFLIYDEPTSGLDPQLCQQIAQLIKTTHDAGEGERTTLVVTHDYEAVVPVATRVLILNPYEGTIEELEKGADPGERLTEITNLGKPRNEIPAKGVARLMWFLQGPMSAPWNWILPLLKFITKPFPENTRQFFLRLCDSLIFPSLYVCSAGAVLGGLSTFFALENNPLKGAMDRQALIGLGKVLIAIVTPLVTAILFAARVGAGAAARLGNIRLGRQDDALRMLGEDPDKHLVTPLFWACFLGMPLLTIPVCIASSLVSLLCACATRNFTPYAWSAAFFDELNYQDLGFGAIKLAGAGVLVAIAAVFYGLKPKSGAEDLGRDVTSTIVAATLLVIIWHGIWTFVQYA